MKTQQFTDWQLKDLSKGLTVTTVESVKKGDIKEMTNPRNFSQPYINGDRISIDCEADIGRIFNGKKTICKVGDIVQAVNEKDEKQWYCPECKKTDCADIANKPLLVRLKKIVEGKYDTEKFRFKTWRQKK